MKKYRFLISEGFEIVCLLLFRHLLTQKEGRYSTVHICKFKTIKFLVCSPNKIITVDIGCKLLRAFSEKGSSFQFQGITKRIQL